MKLISIRLLIILLLFVSCKQKNNSSNTIEISKRLGHFTIHRIYDMGSLALLGNKFYQSLNSKNFNPETDTIKYLPNKIYISFLRLATGCASYTGNVEFNQDTIHLLLINKLETVCSEQDCYRVIYEVENKSNKKYIIQKY
jgi:hypothetical protein